MPEHDEFLARMQRVFNALTGDAVHDKLDALLIAWLAWADSAVQGQAQSPNGWQKGMATERAQQVKQLEGAIDIVRESDPETNRLLSEADYDGLYRHLQRRLRQLREQHEPDEHTRPAGGNARSPQ